VVRYLDALANPGSSGNLWPLDAQVRTLKASTLGRYLVVGPERGPLLVGFHGYGENAELHLEQLRRLPGSERFRLAAVQALHRFYNMKTGEVVGSWMTKLDREQAIADNLAYVAAVVSELARERPASRLFYAGFSQGASMAWRAAAFGRAPCHGVLALGGDMPPDVADDPNASFPPALIGRGARDEWYTEAKMTRDLEVLRSRGAPVETVLFDGGHEWGEPFLAAAGRFLARVGGAD
jgi:predicted esterase